MSLAEGGRSGRPGPEEGLRGKSQRGGRGRGQRGSPGDVRGKGQLGSPRAEGGLRGSTVGDLKGKSGAELREMLERQQRLLENRTFICKLPDKGKKIADFAEKLRLAIAEQEELNRTTELLSAFKLEFQENLSNDISRSKEITCIPEDRAKPFCVSASSVSKNKSSETNLMITENQEVKDTVSASSPKLLEEFNHEDDMAMTLVKGEVPLSEIIETSPNSLSKSCRNTHPNPINGALSDTESCVDAWHMEADMLITGIQQVKITDKVDNNKTPGKSPASVKLENKIPFLSGPQKKLHYIEVLEKRSENPILARPKFRPNQLPGGSNESSRSSSPGQSPARMESTMSAEERRLRDKKHLDDFTSARLPPLHYMPVQLVPIEESAMLQMVQKQTYEEMQAKLAAQRLAERLNIKMVTYNPDDGACMQYREVRDEECYSEDEP